MSPSTSSVILKRWRNARGQAIDTGMAWVLYHKGAFCLRCTGKSPAVTVGERSLRAEELLPLAPGLRFRLGRLEVRVDEVRDDDFKRAVSEDAAQDGGVE